MMRFSNNAGYCKHENIPLHKNKTKMSVDLVEYKIEQKM